MTREEVAAIIKRRTDALNSHDVDAVTAIYSKGCTVESPLAAGTLQGRQAIAKVYQSLFDAFPDLNFAPEVVLIEGDAFSVSAILTGTSTGGFMGLPPSGKPIRVPVVTVGTVSDGEIATERRVYDVTGMLVQAGVLKARPA
jgi:steroid delta-isomerase-like uncharacterized protein